MGSCELGWAGTGRQGAKVPRRRDTWPRLLPLRQPYDPTVQHSRVSPQTLIMWARPLVVAVFLTLVLAGGAASGLATDETGGEADAELLRAGQAVYDANCVACHQADGRGLAGAFPPLLDNPRVADSAYVVMVIRNGLVGEIEVNGEVYNGAMPAFQLLDDDQIAAVTAYIQSGLVAPAAPGAATTAGDLAGTELPIAVVATYAVGFLVFLVVAALVAAPYVLSRGERHEFDWPRAWLKGTVIFLFFTVATVILPSMVMESGPLSRAPRTVQDLIGSGVWFVALAVGIWGLWRSSKERIV